MNVSIAEMQAFAAGASCVALLWCWIKLEKGRDRDRAERQKNETAPKGPKLTLCASCFEQLDDNEIPTGWQFEALPYKAEEKPNSCRDAGRPEKRAEEYRTIDGGHLAPHPGMTDEDLYDFERDMKVPKPTWPSLEAFRDRRRHNRHPSVEVPVEGVGMVAMPPEYYAFVKAARAELVEAAGGGMVRFDDVIARAKAMALAAKITMRD